MGLLMQVSSFGAMRAPCMFFFLSGGPWSNKRWTRRPAKTRIRLCLSYLSLLRARHKVDTVAILSARIGHTHNRLDGVYGCWRMLFDMCLSYWTWTM